MCRHLLAAIFAAVFTASTSWAFDRPAPAAEQEQHLGSSVAQRAFFKPELVISSSNVPFREVRQQLGAQRVKAWDDFFQRYGEQFNVFIDPRSGTPTNVQGRVSLIPGDGVGNQVTLDSLSQKLGRRVEKVDAEVVGSAVIQFVNENRQALGLDVSQLGTPRVTQVTEHLWQLHFPQQVNGVPVRHGRLAATLSHGNLVLLGTETWGNVKTHTLPFVSSDKALESGLSHAGLFISPSRFWKEPGLELVPYAPQEGQSGTSFTGPLGTGYGHRLVWSYGFQNEGDHATWEVSVDAHSGEVLALEDKNAYADARIKGGIYPLTSTEVCPSNDFCGAMQSDTPMPWANTGLAAPNNYTDGAGVYDYTSGTATTTLTGKYIKISDKCGTLSFSGSGDLQMGGTNGDHDCTSGGGSTGNTASARSAFYELNKLAEQARGWLPSNTWLTGQLTTNVNINSTCNAYYTSNTINFYRSGGGCRNTGEIGAVFDHEWGHALDDYDANGSLSNSSEAYADIAAIYRLQASCVGHGFFHTSDKGCGMTADGTSYNQNEAQSGAAHCNLNCSGVRDADWDQHSDHTPDTPQNFVCGKCSSGTGPCGRQVHCAAAPTRQAAWDLVARDLRTSPFNYDEQTAFLIGNKLFYQGSGNVGTWHACDCAAGTSSGCGSTNGYMQWLAADDDNGDLSDGTPHMTAIYNAFNRHNIACGSPAPQNGGCSTGPSAAPSLSASPGDSQVSLSWTSVSGAQNYWVTKSEGFAGCDFGRALKATVTGTTFTDTEVANDRQYCYAVVAAGASDACFSPASTCVCTTPTGGPCTAPGAPSLLSPASGATSISTSPTLDWSDVSGATYEVQVASDSGFTTLVASATGLSGSSWTVSPALSGSTTYYWRVRASNSCGTSAYSSAFSFTTTSSASCGITSASYDSTLKAPSCAGSACGCDTGTLVNSRGAMATSEPSYSNTLAASCADGSSGTYHSDESIDALRIETTDATAFDAGKSVKVSVTVWCYSTSDYLDLYYTTSASNPSWTAIATNVQCPVSKATHTFTQNFTLGTTTGQHAIRAQLRYGGSAGTCTSGNYNDRDDLAFQVGSGACSVSKASYDTTLKAPGCAAASCGCDTGTLVNSRGAMATAEPSYSNTLAASCADGSSGTYHSDESIDRVVLRTTDGSALSPGKAVVAEITAWCYSTSDYLDLYYTTSASSPSWTAIATSVQCPVSKALHTFKQNLTLGSTTGQHAIRAQLRYGGSAGLCTSGSYNDRDDLFFQVSTAAQPVQQASLR